MSDTTNYTPFDFQQFVRQSIQLIEQSIGHGVPSFEKLQQAIGGVWKSPITATLFHQGNELRVFHAEVHGISKAVFKFSGAGKVIFIQIEASSDRLKNIQKEYKNIPKAVENELNSLLPDQSAGDTNAFYKHPEYGVVNTKIANELDVLKAQFHVSKSYEIPQPFTNPLEVLKAPIVVKSERRFYIVEEYRAESFIIEFDDGIHLKIPKSRLPVLRTSGKYIPENHILHYSPTLIAIGKLRLTVDDALEIGEPPTNHELEYHWMRVGEWIDRTPPEHGEYVELVPFQKEKFLNLGGWRGHGHAGSGGCKAYAMKELRKYEHLLSQIRSCHCEWLCDLITSDVPDRTIKEAILQRLYQGSERVSPWNTTF